MTLVTIDLGDVAGGHDPDDHVIIRAENFRESPGGGITSTAEVKIPLVDGVGQSEVEPGPVVVAFRCQAVADTREKRGVVPDSGTVGIEDVLSESMVYTAPVVSRALATINGAVGAAVAGEMGQAVRQATASAVSAEQAAVRAAGRATSAEAEVNAYTPRVTALEAMTGLSPESPVDGQTANLVAQSTTLTREAVDKAIGDNVGAIHVKRFGAIGDGNADDTAALILAMSSGKPLYWGDSKDVYRVTDQLTAPVGSHLFWHSDGARITCQATSPLSSVMYLSLSGFSLHVTGQLHIDAARNAFVCLDIRNDHDTPSDLSLTNPVVGNAYRSSTEHVNGTGIYIRGHFDTITIDHPHVKNITMAQGAGISGAQGVSGISISGYSATRAPRIISIVEPNIDGVYSEDATYGMDQDGVVIFSASDTPGITEPWNTKFSITGGMMRNCAGRAVKSQAEWGVVDGLKIHRDMSRVIGNVDIDFQVGGGLVTNITAQYSGNVPRAVVGFSGPTTQGKKVSAGIISGLQVLVTGTENMGSVVQFTSRSADSVRGSVNNVEVVGTQPGVFTSIPGAERVGKTSVEFSSIFVSPVDSFASLGFSASSDWKFDLSFSGINNDGGSPVPLWTKYRAVVSDPHVQAINMRGFSGLPVAEGRQAILRTRSIDTTNGWNDFQLVMGYGEIRNATYYTPPPGSYRVTYLRPSGVAFDRSVGDSRVTIAPVGGSYQEVVSFSGSNHFRVVGKTIDDLEIYFEALDIPM